MMKSVLVPPKDKLFMSTQFYLSDSRDNLNRDTEGIEESKKHFNEYEENNNFFGAIMFAYHVWRPVAGPALFGVLGAKSFLEYMFKGTEFGRTLARVEVVSLGIKDSTQEIVLVLPKEEVL